MLRDQVHGFMSTDQNRAPLTSDVTWLTPGSAQGQGNAVDAEGDWSVIQDMQSYVRFAHIGHSISNWPEMLRKTFFKLEPGNGYIEIMDFDWQTIRSDASPLRPASPLPHFCAALDYALGRRRTALRPHDRVRQLEFLGFDHIQHRIHRVPFSPGFSTPDMSEFEYDATQHANLKCHVTDMKLLENIGLDLLVDDCGWSEDQARGLIEQCDGFVIDPVNLVKVSLHVWTARRPRRLGPAAATPLHPQVRANGSKM
ncbi:hypothetical protein LTR95_004363 [Oleoguttula sp. CCFEE 5521]